MTTQIKAPMMGESIAEATVAKDGRIVFPSVRDGDMEIYSMNGDGGDVRRLTNLPGPDGGPFFSADGQKIVFRGRHPRAGAELDDYFTLLKQGRVGQLQFWGLGWNSSGTDGNSFVQLLYSKNIGQSNFARLKLKEYDDLYEKAQLLPVGPKRWALYKAMNEIATVYSVWHPGVFRYQNIVMQPWLLNYKRIPFRQHFWHLMDIDESKRPKG